MKTYKELYIFFNNGIYETELIIDFEEIDVSKWIFYSKKEIIKEIRRKHNLIYKHINIIDCTR